MDGGRGGFRNVNDSSTWGGDATSGMVEVWRLGNDILISADVFSLFDSVLSFSSKSGVDVHEIGRLRRGADDKNMHKKSEIFMMPQFQVETILTK